MKLNHMFVNALLWINRWNSPAKQLLILTLIVCILPLILTTLGVDFSSPIPLGHQIKGLENGELLDQIHITLAGSFVHTLLEWSAFCTGVFTAILAFVYFALNHDVVTPIIGVSLFYSGCMDAFHTLASDRLIDGVADYDNLIPFTWAICRLFSALILVVGVSLLLMTKQIKPEGKLSFLALISVVCGVFAYGTILFCVRTENLPQTMFANSWIRRPWDAIPLLLFLGAGLFLLPRFQKRYPSIFSQTLIISIIPQVITQAHMTFGSQRLFDNDFNIAHFLKIVAYLVPFVGLCLSYVEINREKDETVDQLKSTEKNLTDRQQELETLLRELRSTQSQLIQAEKMSSLGQLVSGVAHEINNPVNFIYGNLTHAENYVKDLHEIISLYQHHYPNLSPAIEESIKEIDLEFILKDFPGLLSSMRVGAKRIQIIVEALRNFSRLDESDWKACDIHEGIESTLMILNSRLKETSSHPEIIIQKNYGDLPPVECYPSQINQVLINILTNAIDALLFKAQSQPFANLQITITTCQINQQCSIKISDNGIGIMPEVVPQIFNPFFTTKAVGHGTGLGLSVSYSIIHDQHQGSLTCESVPDQGTVFTILIPLKLRQSL